MINRCANCKYFIYGKCENDNVGLSKQSISDIIDSHIEYAFDGSIQEELNEIVAELELSSEKQKDLIDSICSLVCGHLTADYNKFLDNVGFMASRDFYCGYWE